MTDRTVSVLLLASRFGMPYRVLRCTQAAGTRVYVLGTIAAAGLRRSRFCTDFALTSLPVDGTYNEALATAINQATQEFGIDVVIAGDAPATRSLITIQSLLRARIFPMPALPDFDVLNNKWAFTQLCQSKHVRSPQTWLFANNTELESFLRANDDGRSFIAKPLSQDSSRGVVRISTRTWHSASAQLKYVPILLQEFIEGIDIGTSVFCTDGRIEAFIAHHYNRGRYTPINDASIAKDLQALLGPLKTNGIFNFDMRQTASGQIYYLECNPRVFWKISMSMLAGVNFVAQGLAALELMAPPRQSSAPSAVLFPKALVLQAATAPWHLSASSTQAVRFLYADPMPYFSETLGFEHDPIDQRQ
jgi:hypothetical protein